MVYYVIVYDNGDCDDDDDDDDDDGRCRSSVLISSHWTVNCHSTSHALQGAKSARRQVASLAMSWDDFHGGALLFSLGFRGVWVELRSLRSHQIP